MRVLATKSLTELPKVGDKLRFISDNWTFMETGEVYEVTYADDTEFTVIVSDGTEVGWCDTELGEWELVTDAGDNVDSPSHYTNGKFETIEVIEEITQGYSDGFVAHCAGTAIKYIARAPYKHETPLEDLRKSRRYLDFAIERLESQL